MSKVLFAGLVAGLTAVAGAASAATLVVASYDMRNGDGPPEGSYSYLDGGYGGAGASGDPLAIRSALAGGTGALTDGNVEDQRWDAFAGAYPVGPFVGWYSPTYGDPEILFRFSGTKTVTSVRVAVDSSGYGGVIAPHTLVINGSSYTPTVTAISGSASYLTVSGLNLVGSSVTLTPDGDGWTFLSEVGFVGSGAPEPAAWGLMILGFGAAGVALRRRRMAAA